MANRHRPSVGRRGVSPRAATISPPHCPYRTPHLSPTVTPHPQAATVYASHTIGWRVSRRGPLPRTCAWRRHGGRPTWNTWHQPEFSAENRHRDIPDPATQEGFGGSPVDVRATSATLHESDGIPWLQPTCAALCPHGDRCLVADNVHANRCHTADFPRKTALVAGQRCRSGPFVCYQRPLDSMTPRHSFPRKTRLVEVMVFRGNLCR